MLRQLFDDDASGGALSAGEESALQDFIKDAESEIEQAISKIYGKAGLTWLRAQGTSAPRAVKRMILDLFEVRAFRRHPSYIRAEWIEREKAIERDIERLRLREYELDVLSDPDPAVTDGGEVRSGDPDDTEPKDKVFLDGMGIF